MYDFCITPVNRDLSHGFLSNVEAMIDRLGPDSNLAKSCKAVSFAMHGRALHRPHIVKRAEALYHELLGALAQAIENPMLGENAESRLVAMMLGLYEVKSSLQTNWTFR